MANFVYSGLYNSGSTEVFPAECFALLHGEASDPALCCLHRSQDRAAKTSWACYTANQRMQIASLSASKHRLPALHLITVSKHFCCHVNSKQDPVGSLQHREVAAWQKVLAVSLI